VDDRTEHVPFTALTPVGATSVAVEIVWAAELFDEKEAAAVATSAAAPTSITAPRTKCGRRLADTTVMRRPEGAARRPAPDPAYAHEKDKTERQS
jgi:hypothetical protein